MCNDQETNLVKTVYTKNVIYVRREKKDCYQGKQNRNRLIDTEKKLVVVMGQGL